MQPPYLRLVKRGQIGTPESLQPLKVTRLKLESAQVSPLAVSSTALMALLRSLRGEESLVFQHELRGTQGTDIAQSYDFNVLVQHTQHTHGEFVERVARALLQAYPAINLTTAPPKSKNAEDTVDTEATQAFANSWRVRLAPTILKIRPTVSSYAAQDAFEAAYLPYPSDLPSNCVTNLSRNGHTATQDCRISIRVGAFGLSEAECEQHLKLKRLMDAGMMTAYHPDSPYQKDFSVNHSLMESTGTLLDAWLRHPDNGFATDCTIESNSRLSSLQLQTITQNVFGTRPVQIAETTGDWQSKPPKFTFSDSVKPKQGHPSLVPDSSELSKFGIAEHFDPPVKPPPSSGGAVVGMSVCGAASTLVALPEADRLSHIGIFGASGSGKSTLLLRLIEQDLANPSMPGVGLIDPHGTLYSDVLQIIPRSRINDVVLVDVTDPSFISSINPLAGMKQDRQFANFIANEIVAMIEVLFEGKDTSGPVTRSHIKNALLLSSCFPRRASSFLDASQVFEDADFRDYLLSNCKDKKIRQYWRDFAATTGEYGFQNWLPYIQARLSPFCDSPLMKRMVNNPLSRIDLDRCVAEGKIVLFNLSSAVLGGMEGRIFGNLMLNRIFFAAMKRRLNPSVPIKPFHLVVDEAASMVSPSTMRLWAEARKFGLSLTTANQSISQLRSASGGGEIAQALLANTATKIFFRLSPADAALLEPYAAPEISGHELMRLPVFHCALSMSAHGQILPAFVCKVERPIVDPDKHSLPAAVLDASRAENSTAIGPTVAELAAAYDLPEESFTTANDDPKTKRQTDLFTAAGVPLDVLKTAHFDKFAKLFDEALAFVMGSRWTLNASNIQDKVQFARYFEPEATEPPDFQSVYDRIESDNTLSQPNRFLVTKALNTMRPHFWLEDTTEGVAA